MYFFIIRHYIWLLCTAHVLTKCVYRSFDVNNPPVFTRFVDQKELIIELLEGTSIKIGEGGEINAYCRSNFSSPFKIGDDFSSPSLYLSHITVRCYTNSLFYIISNDKDLQSLEKYPQLSCIDSIQLYHAKIPFCEKQSMAYGLDAGKSSEYLSGVCYDFDTMETSIVHYSTGDPGTSLHPEFYIYQNLKLSIDVLESSVERSEKLNQSINVTWPNPFKSHVYRFDELIPTQNLLRGRRRNANSFVTNSIPWWTNLKDGNWKLVEKITEKMTETRYFDIYTGILHYDKNDFPLEQQSLKYLYYSLNSKRHRIPMFVWKYLKPKIPYEADDEVVLIGVNYPFLTGDQVRSLNFCPDICDKINWLRDLSTWRQFIGFGFIFCCNANDAREKISVIHQIQLAFKNVFTIQEP